MKQKVLFLCTGNSCRSQMAEGWLKHLGGDRFEVFSAGIVAHGKNPRAIAVMKEAGVDISNQQSEQLDPAILDKLDLLVTVCGNADETCPVVPARCEKQHWPFDDPAKATGSEAEIMAEFARVRDQIRLRIEQFVNQQGLKINTL
ncbi:MAG: arsenate reductase (thioredoxin) [Mariprofundaceae bacterium]|nr:arsenate reductase (thioredoxin) [Mariprofundaceae bacterium]